MKPKHDGLFSVVVAAAVICATLAYGSLKHPGEMGRMLSVHANPLPEVQVPAAAALERMEQLEKRIGRLNQPANPEPAPLDLALFGYHPLSLKPGARLPGESIDEAVEPTVSMAFYSANKRFCIIDGVYHTENAKLPDGGRIVKVEARRILIVRNGVQKWIPVTGRSKPQEAASARSPQSPTQELGRIP
jgi:hypothetical protein